MRRVDPQPSSRHPLIVFFFALCAASGISIMLQTTPPPGSIEEALGRVGASAWGATLFLGAGMILTGLRLQPTARHNMTGVLLEQVGMAFIGGVAILYTAAAFALVGTAGAFPASVVLAFGVACLYRYRSLRKQTKRIGQEAQGVTDAGDA